jgi:RNA recognition motif-containing protein
LPSQLYHKIEKKNKTHYIATQNKLKNPIRLMQRIFVKKVLKSQDFEELFLEIAIFGTISSSRFPKNITGFFNFYTFISDV